MAPGGKSMKEHLQTLAEKQGFSEKLIFAGVASHDDVVEAYSSCDLFVYPGLLEAGGLPPLEAMACNCPVVATATGISAELGEISPAFSVVKPGDPEALAEGILHLLSIPKEQRKEQSSQHRQIVEEKFNFEHMVDQILAFYEKILNG
jgi:glycosyltransferase involved in cell wall biosynthesis